MSNSSKWRRLMEWVRYLQDTGGEVNLQQLVDKIAEIKTGRRITWHRESRREWSEYEIMHKS